MIDDCRVRIADCLAVACGLWTVGCHVYARVNMLGSSLVAVLLLPVLLCAGCGQPQMDVPTAEQQPRQEVTQAGASGEAKPVDSPPVVPTGFAPAKICILPLTELSGSTPGSQAAALTAYVGLMDAFGCQIKAPGVVRFELYQYVPRSAEPRGQRLAIWPDIDLTHPATNNSYWRDFLRAYEFKLDVPAGMNETYVLEATCLCPDGRRLTATLPLHGGGK